jgi:hypothetical protein
MLKKRLLTVLMVLNAFSGLMPAMLLAAPKKQEIYFELAQEQCAGHLTEKLAQDFVKKADRFCASRLVEMEKKTAGNRFEILILSALVGDSKNAKAELESFVNVQQIGGYPSFKQDCVFLPEWVESHIIAPSVFGSFLVGWVGLPSSGYSYHQDYWSEFKVAFEEKWNSLAQARRAASRSLNVEKNAQYQIKYQEMVALLKETLQSDVGDVNGAVKNQMLQRIESNRLTAIANRAWWSSAVKIAGVVFIGSLVVAGIEKYLQERNERAAKTAFNEFMQKPDAHILLAQKLNEFCAAMTQKS